jgi:hypothetical protein
MGLCTPPPAGERGRKKGISPVGILLERACRERHLAQKKRETHISRHVLCVCTVIHPSHRSRSPFSLSFSPQQKIRALRIKNLIITIVKTNAEENDATRNEKRHRISPKTNNKQRV